MSARIRKHYGLRKADKGVIFLRFEVQRHANFVAFCKIIMGISGAVNI